MVLSTDPDHKARRGPCWRRSVIQVAHTEPGFQSTDLLPSTEKRTEGDTHKETEYKTRGFSFYKSPVQGFSNPSHLLQTHTRLVSVCSQVHVFTSYWWVCIGVCFLYVRLFVFFSWSKVELHGFVDLPVLFTDELQGEGTVQNLRTKTSMKLWAGPPSTVLLLILAQI